MNFLGLTKVFRLGHFNSSWWYMGIAILFIISIPLFVKLFKHYGYFPFDLILIYACAPPPYPKQWHTHQNNT